MPGRHHRPRKRLSTRLTLLLAGVAVGALVASGLVVVRLADSGPAEDPAPRPAAPREGGIAFEDDELPAAPGAGPCTSVRVLASYENRPVLKALAAGYQGTKRNVNGRCVQVSVSVRRSGLAVQDATAGFDRMPVAERPAIWSPDSSAWLGLARGSAPAGLLPDDVTSLARTPIVLAMPKPQAGASGWQTDPPTWRGYLEAAADETFWAERGHPEWGEFRVGRTSPEVSSSGLFSLLAAYRALGPSPGARNGPDAAVIAAPATRDAVRRAELAVVHYMASQEHFLWHVRQGQEAGDPHGFVSAVTTDEKAVWDYNRGIVSRDGVTRTKQAPPDVPLVPIYPSDGTYTVDSPLAILDAPWVDADTSAAAADFARFARTSEGQQIVREGGYRDVNGKADPEIAAMGDFGDLTGLPILRQPPAEVIRAAKDSFPTVRKRARVLFAVDVSNSMRQKIPGGETRLAAAKSAIIAALDHFTPDDEVGLAGFSNSRRSEAVVPGVLVPVEPLRTQRDALVSATRELQPLLQTPLYAAVTEFARRMAGPGHDPDKINAIVLLSDGKNDTIDKTTAAQMTAALTALDDHREVLIFTLAYADEADKPALEDISKTTHAHFYDATDPARLPAVLGELVTSF